MLQKKKDRRAVVAIWPSLKETSVGPQKVAYKKKKKIKFNADAGAEAQSECCFVVKLSQRE